MSKKTPPVWIALAVLAVLLVPVTLLAEDSEDSAFLMNKDGSLIVKGQHYGSMVEWQTSKAFQEGGHRCASQDAKNLRPSLFSKAAADCSMSSTTIRTQYGPSGNPVYTIPVVFHIVQQTNGTGNVSDSLIQSQLDILNEDFRAQAGSLGAGGFDAGIQFVMATTDPSGNATNGITRTTSNAYFTDPGPGAFNDMKQALNWDTTKYLNIYSNDAAGNLGYATFPAQDAGEYLDGVVLLWSSVGRNAPQGGIYNQGRTATHEIGHYLGLFHTFQSGCGTASSPYTTGDLLADTPRQSAPNYNCPSGASSCSSIDPIENYMNYTQDTCMDRFSAEQANRMRCSIESYRASLVGGTTPPPTGNTLTNGVPETGLSGSTGAEVDYTMDVPAGASNLAFNISGGSGDADLYVKFGSAPTTTSYDCRPYIGGNNETCSFASPSTGTYHVMVRAYSTYSGVSLVGTYDAPGANNPPSASFTSSTNDLTANFTDTSTDSDGTIASRSWTFGDGTSSTAQNPTHTYASAGTYTVNLTVTDNDGATDSASGSVTVTAPTGAPCTGCEEYNGSLTGTGDSDAHPNGTYYFVGSAGTHQGWLEGPAGADFDLELYRWTGSWTKVAESISSTSSESISYNGASGYYYWRIRSYSGSGSYTFWLDRP